MKTARTQALLTAVAAAAYIGTAHAGTIDSASYGAVTNSNVSTAGTLDWGYVSAGGTNDTGFLDSNLGGVGASYNDTDYGSLVSDEGNPLTTVNATPSIGNVTLTEGTGLTAGTDRVTAQNGVGSMTFDGNTAYGQYGNLAGGEADAWQMDFNDLGVGTFTITLYMGHSTLNRVFRIDSALSDGGPDLDTNSATSAQIGTIGSTVTAYSGGGAAFTYDITVTTSSATEDLSLVFSSVTGNAGGAIFFGYTVVPEPSSLAFLGLGGLFIARRRR